MNEMKQLMTELTDRLRKTNEYNQYINVLSRLKQDSELYARIGDYRRRSLWIQMQERSEEHTSELHHIEESRMPSSA